MCVTVLRQWHSFAPSKAEAGGPLATRLDPKKARFRLEAEALSRLIELSGAEADSTRTGAEVDCPVTLKSGQKVGSDAAVNWLRSINRTRPLVTPQSSHHKAWETMAAALRIGNEAAFAETMRVRGGAEWAEYPKWPSSARVAVKGYLDSLPNDYLDSLQRGILAEYDNARLTLRREVCMADGRVEKPRTLPEHEEQAVNSLLLDGQMWSVCFGDEDSTFPDREDSGLRHLARLFAEPNRRFSPADFYPPPPGQAPIPNMGRDNRSDGQAMSAYERDLFRLARDIQEAEKDGDFETAAKLRTEFGQLSEHVESEKAAMKGKHRKQTGSLSPDEKASQSLRMAVNRAIERFRGKGMPNLAEHIKSFVSITIDVVMYAPPPGALLWEVTHPSTIPPKNPES
jgi:hypothetical protein